MSPAHRYRRFRSAHFRQGARSAVATLSAIALVFGLAVAGGVGTEGVSNAAPPTSMTVTKAADARVLVGESITYTLRAQNNGTDIHGDRLYNLSFRDQLPASVTYVAGSSAFADGATLPDPKVITIDPDSTPSSGDEYQVLIWSNVSDLPGASQQAITFRATPSATKYPVGATVSNDASAYANSDPRYVPKFDASGDVATGTTSYTASGASGTATTQITAIKIDKSENSPEHELMRGAHDQSGIYTLKVTNNGHAATDDVEVVDYLPAGLEFLQCGGIDNGAAATYEYGSRRLTENAPTVSSCENPYSVETVAIAANTISAPGGGHLAAGVYTKVTWKPADLAASGTWTTKYAVAIPQRENALFADPAPDATCSDVSGTWTCPQAANLDNNTGPSTREKDSTADSQDGETGWTNLAEASGNYQGTFASGASNRVSDADQLTVTAEDIAIQKSVSPTTFEQGAIATYTLNVQVSEYVDASNIVITDVIPDGLCPVKSGNACTEDVSEWTGVTDATVASITHDSAAGTYTVVFEALDSTATEHNKTVSITYPVLMRPTYDQHASAPTVSGDDYTNHVSLVGNTTTRNNVNAPSGDEVVLTEVRDASEATITSDSPTLKKTILPNTVSGAYQCGATTPSYTDNAALPANAPDLTFHIGDRVCFKIRVDFSGNTNTKNPVITDFLPEYVEYEAGSAVAVGAVSTVVAALDDSKAADGMLTWTVGTAGAGGDKFVPKGRVFEWTLAAIVTGSPATSGVDVTGNLAKLTWTNTDGTVSFLRDQVDFSTGTLLPTIGKSHTPAGPFHGGETVSYTITVTNNDIKPITNVLVKDELPTGIACGDVSAISDAGACTGSSPSVISWTIASIGAGAFKSLTYTMTIPADPRVGTTYRNYTGVAEFNEEINHNGDDTTTGSKKHYPNNGRPALKTCAVGGSPECDTPAIQADDTVSVVDVSIAKTQTTGIDATNNDANTQAVIGETITYTVTGTIPKHTTVYQGTISDPMPTGIELISATANLDSGSNLNAGSNTNVGGSNTVTWSVNTKDDSGADEVVLALGPIYTNSTSSDQVFTLTINARVTQLAGNTHGTTRRNTATFARYNQASGGSKLTDKTASQTATIVEPNPTITKADDSSGKVTAGQDVQFTVTIGNTTGRPTLYDVTVVDCLPAGLAFKSFDSPPSGAITSHTPGDGTNGCAADQTKLAWTDLPNLEAGAAATDLEYTATVDTAAAGGASYVNSVAVHGNDLTGDTKGDGTANIGRIYTATTTHTVTVKGAGITKSVAPTSATVGETVTYTVTATLPKNVNFYDAVVHDELPDGISLGDAAGDTCTLDGVDCTGVSRQAASGQKVGWSLGDLASAATDRTIVISYKATVVDATSGSVTAPVAGDTLVNAAYIGWNPADGGSPAEPGTDPTQKTTDATATVTVLEPSLSIAKKVQNGASGYLDTVPADPSDTVQYQVTVTNGNGANVSTARAITVADVVPSGITVDTATISDGGSYYSASRTITWTLTDLAKAASKDFTYSAAVTSVTTTQTNTATVSSYCSVAVGAAETCTGNGGRGYTGPSDTASVTPHLPHVVVAKTATDGDIAYIGEPKEFTITSDGDSAAKTVAAVDTLPANWTYDANSATVSVAGAASTHVNPSIVGQQLTWTNLGDLPDKNDAGNKTIVITYSATPGAAVVTSPGINHYEDDGAGGVTTVNPKHTNTVSVTAQDASGATGASDGAGGTTPYNGGPATVDTYIHAADVAIVKAVGTQPDAETSVANGTWTITVTNLGPDTAVGPFTVQDAFAGSTAVPAGFTVTSVSGTGWTCTETSGTTGDWSNGFSCTRSGSLAKGSALDAITVGYTVDFGVAAANATWTNTATVDGMKTYDPHDKTHGDPAENNNTSTETMGLKYADLKITKVHAPTDRFRAGETINYTITVTNLGKDTAKAPKVSDSLPADFDPATIAFASDGDWNCSASGADITCTAKADLAKDATISFVVSATLKSDYARTRVQNTAKVESVTPDPVKPNNEATDTWNPPSPPAPSTTTSATPTPTKTPTSPAPSTATTPATTPTIPTITPSSATGTTTPPPPTNVPAVTTNVPEPNQCVDLVEHGFEPGETVTITITGPDGQYTITAVADENGDVAFCLKSAVPVSVVIEVLGEHHVVVREVVLGVGGELPNTGVPTARYLTWALLLLGAGIALVLFGRRGRNGKHYAR